MPPQPLSQPSLLTPPATVSPQTALHLSQRAPLLLSKSPTSSLPWPLSLLFNTETPDTWTIHENALYASLRTGDDATARQLLSRLTARFGEENPRVLTLRGIYEETVAKNNAELEAVLKNYDKFLKDDPTLFPIRKRRAVVLKALGRTQDAVAALVELVDQSPADAEAWAELGDLYKELGSFSQAIYCWEEVLLFAPNSWAAHAHIATIHHLSNPTSLPCLTLSFRHFARSVELNESFLRGYYGLKLLSSKLIPILSSPPPTSSKRNQADDSDADIPPPKIETVKKLDELATKKLAEIVRRYSKGENGWTGYEEAEVIAARELLDREGKGVVR